MAFDKKGEIYVVGYRPVPNLDHDNSSPCQDDVRRKLKYDLCSVLENFGLVIINDGYTFNINSDDKYSPRCPYQLHNEKEERKKYVPRPTLIVIALKNGRKYFFVVQKKDDLNKFEVWAKNLIS